ncbi:hypothetical protein AVEN_219051-1 [Araneus ventricosus]|uniref:Uncharacterized protein n=1 Tax=Araneus ventricosus TaxID=182803 RepID=A0A4Y2WST3_ARAVE|nr:hypothetical protein AVEN_219051-1 [Araneus ventricosus]
MKLHLISAEIELNPVFNGAANAGDNTTSLKCPEVPGFPSYPAIEGNRTTSEFSDLIKSVVSSMSSIVGVPYPACLPDLSGYADGGVDN